MVRSNRIPEIAATDQRDRLVCLIAQAAPRQGTFKTAISGVTVMHAAEPLPRQPVIYEPCVVIVAQGRKRGFVGDKVHVYDPHHYLVLTLPMPFECETEVGDPKDGGGPMLAVKIGVDLELLSELLAKAPHRAINGDAAMRAIASTPIDARLGDAAVRLMECLQSPADAAVLGRPIVREILWRVLNGRCGDSLRALAAMNGRMNLINRALQKIHAGYAQALDIPTLAGEVAMSPSAFHQHFKAATATSPLQYVKMIRLHKARMLMAQDGLNASEAAGRVGYHSPSQFSREFKRFFGKSPVDELARVRRMMGLDAVDPQQLAMA